MPTFVVPIDAYVFVEADNFELAWKQAVNDLSNAIGDLIDANGGGGVSFGEPEREKE